MYLCGYVACSARAPAQHCWMCCTNERNIVGPRFDDRETIEMLALVTGLPMANPVEVCVDFVVFLFFSVSVKVLPVTPLLSGGFVHRAFCAYFLSIERVVGNA